MSQAGVQLHKGMQGAAKPPRGSLRLARFYSGKQTFAAFLRPSTCGGLGLCRRFVMPMPLAVRSVAMLVLFCASNTSRLAGVLSLSGK